ncbi:helix-turn-helix domain-containing GNAT family N-acetyltransferase [Pleionea sp. CnH1-48]|uniref:bifunctional helix-turn-helix transcriptional regulator/GNAT family N-acetyltransferase n=1 Tax=Pleionea sp. CnH1-48 TaxID=2954494 RepID=UPI0020979BD8|nr:helix-turn-helix domain-containing GNAT family N-acetyltransferase [Pleionea sp. CnH1-48]MCO7224261.1 bifunctional helix-turn-helix transcriptional regulator/GNAT family N-acetyltransferase [Pleionea sp. CnH1-48]
MKDLISSLGFLAGATRFRRISEKMYLDGDKLYQDAGVDFRASWFSVFFTLAQASAPLRVTEIADKIDFTHVTVNKILKQLDDVGLVEINNDPNDRRARSVSLSTLGKQRLLEVQPIWQAVELALRQVFDFGHPDLLNSLSRIEDSLAELPVHVRINQPDTAKVSIIDYYPAIKPHYSELVELCYPQEHLRALTEQDRWRLQYPERVYQEQGGFLLFARYQQAIVGCCGIKRLGEQDFECLDLIVKPDFRHSGIGRQLVYRAVARCKENQASRLWAQAPSINKGHDLFELLGFVEPASSVNIPELTASHNRSRVRLLNL